MKYSLLLVITLLLTNCGGPSLITTQWEAPSKTKLRISQANKGVVTENILPAIINLDSGAGKNQQSIFGSKGGGYFVEIFTPSNQRLYGTLEVYEGTKLTELTNVKVEITEAIINKVMDNQVSQITVLDPSADKNIILLN